MTMRAEWTEALPLRGARVLVTGAGGFLGQHVMEALRGVGAVPIATTRADTDLRDPGAVRALFARARPELVVHAAAVGGGIGWMKDHPATALAGNVLVNTNVLQVAQEAGVRRLLGVSSACAYAKEATNRALAGDLATNYMVEADLFSILFSTEDAKEGLRAFTEKRAPDFKGR